MTADEIQKRVRDSVGGIVPTDRLIDLIAALPADEQRSALLALKLYGDDAADILTVMLNARARTEQRRKSDRKTDRQRRVLIGTRVRKSAAMVYRQAAADEGLSLNAWVNRALMAAVNVQYADDEESNPFYGW